MPQRNLALFIPGFLGLPQDWQPTWEELKAQGLADWELRSLDLLSRGKEPWQGSLNRWAKELNDSLAQESGFDQRVVIGYSLGGRLALELLSSDPKLWQAGIIISAHPGLTDEKAKAARCRQDELWAQRFETESWGELMQAWNGQAVFRNGTTINRQEEHYSRQALASALRTFSLGEQRDHRPFLQEAETPILWITGKMDQKFTSLAEELPANDLRTNLVISEAGHRIPMEPPKKLAGVIKNFLD